MDRTALNKSQYQKGFVSIIVTAIVMILLSLITIGFTTVMQREQRQALDRQLSRQATYAAESGINETWSFIESNADSSIPSEKDECNPLQDLGGLQIYDNEDDIKLNGDSIEITCVLYDRAPEELLYSLPDGETNIVNLGAESGNNIEVITLRWRPQQDPTSVAYWACGTPGTAGGNNFPSTSSAALIRLSLTRISSGSISRDSLDNATHHYYLRPCNGGSGAADLSSTPNRTVENIDANCSTGVNSVCEISITVPAASEIMAQFRALYSGTNLTISATEVGTGNAVEFTQAQTAIDVTARATDEVRRLRASLPVGIPNNLPNAVVQSVDGICKEISIQDGDDDASTHELQDECPRI